MTWQPLKESQPMRNGVPVENEEDTTQWMNDQYVVFRREIFNEDPEKVPSMFHLSIRNQDRSTNHNWRDFQRIKNQLAGPEYEGIEIYPPESCKVDTANQYHLFCFPFRIGIGFSDTRVVTDPEVTDIVEPGAVQEPNEPVDGPLNSAEELQEFADKHKAQGGPEE